MTLPWLAIAFVAGLETSQPELKPPPKEPDEPFSIYVFTEVPGDPDDGSSLGRTAEEVTKQIRDRKKWFRIVETADEADIQVELLDQASKQEDETTYVTRTENLDEPNQQIARFGDVKDNHVLTTLVHVPKGRPLEMSVAAEGRRPRDTAKPFARRFEMFVRQNYWTLMEALER